MSHLLAIAVGPVQEFIAAARRTRDLWFGSWMLSEVSRATAKALARHGTLIFPAGTNAPNVANIILVQLNDGVDPASAARAGREAARDRWEEYASEAHAKASGVICQDIWDDQVDDVIESYAAWTPLIDDYPKARRRVMQLLAGRKAMRDFQAAKGRAGVFKSSLDGARESVLKRRDEWSDRDQSRLRVRKGEQLDVVGVVKRLAGGTRRYPSITRLAADPWVRARDESRLAEVVAACENLGEDVVRRIDVSTDGGHPHFAAFPFEGTALYRNRHHELMEETGVGPERLRDLAAALARLPKPDPYLAVLIADGDRMGVALSRLETMEEHQEFSRKLGEFAVTAREIVNRHNGVLVYAGGDDVLAFAPLDRCLDCARALQEEFVETVGRSTLSVGVAIGHFMEDLEILLEYGRAAERHAKEPDRNGLAVHLHKRGGSPIQVRAQWKDDLDRRITETARLFRDRAMPGRLAYELRRLADVYQSWPSDTVTEAIQKDVIRVVRDKQPRTAAGPSALEEIEQKVKARVRDADSLRRFAEECLVARQLGVAMGQSGDRVTASGNSHR